MQEEVFNTAQAIIAPRWTAPAPTGTGFTTTDKQRAQQQLTKDEAEQLFKDHFDGINVAKKLVQEDPEPVALNIDRISRNGKMDIKFSQQLLIPTFLDTA